MSQSAFHVHLEQLRMQVEVALEKQVLTANWPESLKSAVGYSLMAGGKRLRPVLVLLANEVCGGNAKDAMPAACAMEMIHTYSLIHDDLPSMDNDDFRRGRPTSHKVYGEALATLAGDCLLTQAFESLSFSELPSHQVAEMTRVLATAAGGAGMVGGQVLDLEAERGPFFSGNPSVETQAKGGQENGEKSGCGQERSAVKPGEMCSAAELSGYEVEKSHFTGNDSNQSHLSRVQELIRIHRMKTGALIAAALDLGAVSAGADQNTRSHLRKYGHCIGLAFQIADDLLDVTGDKDRLGKTPGRDVDLGKLTYPALLGIEESRSKAGELVLEGQKALEIFGDGAVWLKDLASFIVERDH